MFAYHLQVKYSQPWNRLLVHSLRTWISPKECMHRKHPGGTSCHKSHENPFNHKKNGKVLPSSGDITKYYLKKTSKATNTNSQRTRACARVELYPTFNWYFRVSVGPNRWPQKINLRLPRYSPLILKPTLAFKTLTVESGKWGVI